MLIVYLSLVVIPMVANDTWRGAPGNLLIDGWARWDSGWYKGISEAGYSNLPNEAGQRDTAFFPLYPLLLAAARFVCGNSILAGVLVSNLAFALGLVLLYEFAKQRFSTEVAWRAVVLVSIFPFSFIFGALYTESVFFLASMGAFYFAERRRWFVAALFGIGVATSKTLGVTIALPLAVLYMQQREWQWKRIDASVVAVASPLVGLAAYALYLQHRFGDPLAFVHAQNAAGWSSAHDQYARLELFVDELKMLSSPSGVLAGDFHMTNVANIVAILWAIPLAVGAWRVLGPAYSIWSFLVIASSLGIWIGFGRYIAPVFPLFVTMAVWLRRESWFLGVGYFWTGTLTLLAILFSHFYWIG